MLRSKKLIGIMTLIMVLTSVFVPNLTASAKASMLFEWDWANIGDSAVVVNHSGWYATAPNVGTQVAAAVVGNKLVYDATPNAGLAETNSPVYAIAFQHKPGVARLVYNVGSDKYTFRLPFKITNANKDVFVGNGMDITIHNGSTEIVLCTIGYKGSIKQGNTEFKGNNYLKEGTEYIFDFVMDTNGNIVLYVNNVLIKSYKVTAIGQYINTFRAKIRPVVYGAWQDSKYEFGNAKLYKGDIHVANNITPSLAGVMIPPEGKTVQVEFTSVGTEAAGEGAVWSLGGVYDGVTMSSDGKMTVSGSAKAGTVSVVLTNSDGISTTLNYPLKKIDIDFEDYTIVSESEGNWFTGEIREDTDNRYMHAEAAHDGLYPQARFRVPASLSGKFVIEAKVRKPEGHIGSSLAIVNAAGEWNSRLHFTADSEGLYAQYDWNADGSEKIYVPEGEWIDVKIVVDSAKKLATYFVDGKLLTDVNTSMKYSDASSAIKYVISELDIDDFKVYNAYVASPEAYNVKINGNAYPTAALTAQYTYFSMNDYEDYCTDIKWYAASSLTAESWDVVGSGLTYTPGSDMNGKFVKIGVTPSCAEIMAGETVYSEPVEIRECIEVTGETAVITNEGGEGAIVAGTNTATYSLALNNFTASNKTIWVIAAAYEDGMLVGADIEPKLVLSGETDIDAQAEVTATFTDASKAEFGFFVWDDSCDPIKSKTTNLDY